MTGLFGRHLNYIGQRWNRRSRAVTPRTDTPLSFVHRFEKGIDVNARPVLLLHGTAQNENDLMPLGRRVAPSSPLLSRRGKILENGAPRFFKRFAEGVLDEDDVRRRAEEFADFIVKACENYQISTPIVLGYSNGANMATAVMLLRPETLAGAILLRVAQIPFSQAPSADLVTIHQSPGGRARRTAAFAAGIFPSLFD
jgi:phospholipase/carboxylesterase